jgi:hypothetical protein
MNYYIDINLLTIFKHFAYESNSFPKKELLRSYTRKEPFNLELNSVHKENILSILKILSSSDIIQNLPPYIDKKKYRNFIKEKENSMKNIEITSGLFTKNKTKNNFKINKQDEFLFKYFTVPNRRYKIIKNEKIRNNQDIRGYLINYYRPSNSYITLDENTKEDLLIIYDNIFKNSVKNLKEKEIDSEKSRELYLDYIQKRINELK